MNADRKSRVKTDCKMPAMKKGGKVKESMMEKKMGKNMAKAKMQKVATKAVKGHEARMHKGAKKA
jgi:hypothetical protein